MPKARCSSLTARQKGIALITPRPYQKVYLFGFARKERMQRSSRKRSHILHLYLQSLLTPRPPCRSVLSFDFHAHAGDIPFTLTDHMSHLSTVIFRPVHSGHCFTDSFYNSLTLVHLFPYEYRLFFLHGHSSWSPTCALVHM